MLDTQETLDNEAGADKGDEDVEQVKRNPVLSVAELKMAEKVADDEEEELDTSMQEEETNPNTVVESAEEDDEQKELA